MKKQAILLAATAAAAIFSSSSMAVTFYTSGFGGFVQPASPSFPVPVNWWGGEVIDGTTVYSSVSWGTPFGGGTGGPFNGQSGLSINAEDPADGPITPPFNPSTARALATPTANTINNVEVPPNKVELGNLTHWNEPINEFFGPDDVGIRYFKNIYSDAAHTTLLAALVGNFTLSVTETENFTDPANCAPYPPPGHTSAAPGCDDYFTYTGSFTGDTTFTYQGVTYTVTTDGFYPDRTFTGIAGTFFSAEGGNNTGFVAETIAVPVPEPGTLALIGAGLLGAAAIRRRSKVA